MKINEITEAAASPLTKDARKAIFKILGDDGKYQRAWNDKIKNGRKLKIEIDGKAVNKIKRARNKIANALKDEMRKAGHDVTDVSFQGSGWMRGSSTVVFKVNVVYENATAGATSSGAVATAPAQGVAYAGAPYGTGTKNTKKKKKKKSESIETTIIRRP